MTVLLLMKNAGASVFSPSLFSPGLYEPPVPSLLSSTLSLPLLSSTSPPARPRTIVSTAVFHGVVSFYLPLSPLYLFVGFSPPVSPLSILQSILRL